MRNWKKPITIARHAYGDVYKNAEMRIPGPARRSSSSPAQDGTETRELIYDFKGAGVVQGMHNLDDSIESFARSCFKYALDTKQDLWFATKDTISKKYDHTLQGHLRTRFTRPSTRRSFEAAGIEYFYTLIDDAVARVMQAEGGFIWACKNYDGDVMSDMVSTAFGSPGHDDLRAREPRRLLRVRGRPRHGARATTTSTSRARRPPPTPWPRSLPGPARCASAASWTAPPSSSTSRTAWRPPRSHTIEAGKMTGDLARITSLENPTTLGTREFILAIRETLDAEAAA